MVFLEQLDLISSGDCPVHPGMAFFFFCSEPQLSGFLVSAACLFLLCRAGLGRAVYGVVVVIRGLWGGELHWGGMWISLIQWGPCMNVGALWG